MKVEKLFITLEGKSFSLFSHLLGFQYTSYWVLLVLLEKNFAKMYWSNIPLSERAVGTTTQEKWALLNQRILQYFFSLHVHFCHVREKTFANTTDPMFSIFIKHRVRGSLQNVSFFPYLSFHEIFLFPVRAREKIFLAFRVLPEESSCDFFLSLSPSSSIQDTFSLNIRPIGKKTKNWVYEAFYFYDQKSWYSPLILNLYPMFVLYISCKEKEKVECQTAFLIFYQWSCVTLNILLVSLPFYQKTKDWVPILCVFILVRN